MPAPGRLQTFDPPSPFRPRALPSLQALCSCLCRLAVIAGTTAQLDVSAVEPSTAVRNLDDVVRVNALHACRAAVLATPASFRNDGSTQCAPFRTLVELSRLAALCTGQADLGRHTYLHLWAEHLKRHHAHCGEGGGGTVRAASTLFAEF
jgi:hypothetical protein